MRVSGFTIARNVLKFGYPVVESIRSILPVVDEFIVNVGDSEDGTLDLIRSIRDPKIRIIENTWDMTQGPEVLSGQTNLALKECAGDWAFYLQSDEVVHEADLPKLTRAMQSALGDDNVDALRLRWLHFYGSYYRYRIDLGWYQKQDRIIRNDGRVESCGDAFGFRRTDGQEIRRKNTGAFVYHYGWVQTNDVMTARRANASEIGFTRLADDERRRIYDYGDLERFPAYFGSNPSVMRKRIHEHALSFNDWQQIGARYWWHPFKWLRVRLKTGKRVKTRIN